MSLQKEDMEESNITQLRLVTGGKQPPKRGKNWLRDLNQWAVFLARNVKQSESELFLFQLRAKYGNACELFCFIPKEQQPHIRYFSMEHFSNEYELTETLEDGTSSGTNPSDGLEVDADIKDNDTLPGEAG